MHRAHCASSPAHLDNRDLVPTPASVLRNLGTSEGSRLVVVLGRALGSNCRTRSTPIVPRNGRNPQQKPTARLISSSPARQPISRFPLPNAVLLKVRNMSGPLRRTPACWPHGTSACLLVIGGRLGFRHCLRSAIGPYRPFYNCNRKLLVL